jgi:hypothetical protein
MSEEFIICECCSAKYSYEQFEAFKGLTIVDTPECKKRVCSCSHVLEWHFKKGGDK